MKNHLKLYTLGFFTVAAGVMAAGTYSDRIGNKLFSSDKNPVAACECNADRAQTATHNGSFAAPAGNDNAGLIELNRIDKLVSDFNRDNGKVRLVSLASPSCQYCVAAIRVTKDILNRNPDLDIEVFVVWQAIKYNDHKKKAERTAVEFSDVRINQYWDGKNITGKTWQNILGLEATAWDIHMVYGSQTDWNSQPTLPAYWTGELHEVKRQLEKEIRQRIQEL